MKKTKLIVALLLAVMMLFTFALVACEPDPEPETTTTTTITLKNKNGATGESSIVLEEFLAKVASNQGSGWKGDLYSYYRGVGWGKQLSYYTNSSGFAASAAVPGITVNTDGTVTYNYAANTPINASIGYQNANSAISFKELSGAVTLPTGTYTNGDLKPVWEELQNRLGVTFTDSFPGLSSEQANFTHWSVTNNYTHSTNGLVNIAIGRLKEINEAGRAGSLVNLADYLDYMPNFKAFLEENPLTYLSLLANTDTGAFYTIPYFDGYDDMERYVMMQVDMVSALLNGTGNFASSKNAKTMNKTVAYEAYMPTTGSVDIEASNAAGTATTTVTKNYDAALTHFKTESWYADGTSGNIVDIANAYRKSTGATYVGLVNVLRKYIDVAYGSHYGNNRGDLFTGVNSAWDADELVVLLHCVIGNAFEFNDSGEMTGIFTRDNSRTDRLYDLIRLAGQLFGVRGAEARTDYLYFDSEGNLVDGRQEISMYEMSIKLNAMFQEGLIDADYANSAKAEAASSTDRIQKNTGFMMYDYVQSQTAKTVKDGEIVSSLQPVLTPVALWYDGTNINTNGEDEGVYMRFTESWRSVKTTGAAITKQTVTDSPDTFIALLRMVDYFYTWEGRVLMTYGPDEFIEQDATKVAEGKTGSAAWKTFSYNGEQHPLIAESITSSTGTYYFNKYSGVAGSYTNWARRYIGTTLCLTEKMQSFEMQLTDANGKAGEELVATAVGLGLINHVTLSIPTGTNANWWYVSIPVSIAQTTNQDNVMNEDIPNLVGDYQYFSQTSGQYNLFVQIVLATVTVTVNNS